MPLDPAQRVFSWYDDQNYKASVAQELAVRESVTRMMPLIQILIDESEQRVIEEITDMLDTDQLHQRLNRLEDKLDLVIQAIRSKEDPAESLSNLETRTISLRELGDVEQLHNVFLQKAFSELNQVKAQMCDTQEELQTFHHGLGHLHNRFLIHIQNHAEDEDAADWWKRGEEPFSDDIPF